MVQDMNDIVDGECYTIYYANNDASSLKTMYGIPDFRDGNSILFKSLDQSSHHIHKMRYNTSDERSKEFFVANKDGSRHTRDVDVYDCVPWKSEFDIQCFAYHWGQFSGDLKICMPGFDANPISKQIGDKDEFVLIFEDGTSIKFSGIYKNSHKVGSLIFEDKDVLEGHKVEINNNIWITELNCYEKPWFTEQVPFSEDVNGFRIQIDNPKRYYTINREQKGI